MGLNEMDVVIIVGLAAIVFGLIMVIAGKKK